MSKVQIGHAKSNEFGTATGGKPGNQNGRELMIENWYLNSKGWNLLRAKSAAVAAKIAQAARAACVNRQIGYCQNTRNQLQTEAAKFGFDPAKVTKAVNTDCSALVRVCLAFAGITVPNIHTATMVDILMKTGMFELITDANHTTKPDFLRTGDILVTRTKGHTVVILNDGVKAGTTATPATTTSASGTSRPTLREGSKGNDVKDMQGMLVSAGGDLGKWGADGSFGPATLAAVRAFQTANGLSVDGVVGPKTWAALEQVGGSIKVRITGGSVHVRTLPDANSKSLGTVQKGMTLPYLNETIGTWHKVEYKGGVAWVSAKPNLSGLEG